MTKDQKILKLKKRILDLENENEVLRKRLDGARGVLGEKFVAELTGGVLTRYKTGHDIEMQNGTHLEVKTSKPYTERGSTTTRWAWSNILGLNATKKFHYLVLLGEKDLRYKNCYPPDLEYVCFLVPRSDVNDKIKNSWATSIALNTNLPTAKAKNLVALKGYLVHSREEFKGLSPNAAAPEQVAGAGH